MLQTERERFPQSVADTSYRTWDTKGVAATTKEKEKQDFSLIAVLGPAGDRPTRGEIFHTTCLETDSKQKKP